VVPVHAVSAVLFHLAANYTGEQVVSLTRALQWFTGHALGAAIYMPAANILCDRRRFRSLKRPTWQLLTWLAGLAVLTAMLFLTQPTYAWFLVFPALMVLTFRHGPIGSAAGALIITALALVCIYRAPSADQAQSEILWVQFFVAIVFLSSLPAAGAVASFARTRSLLARRTRTARAARRRADVAAAVKSEFLANMSHEIRTPLNGVIGLADALSRTELAAPQREMLNMILGSGEALTGLLSDTLDLAQADSGELKLAAAPFDVREAVSDAAFLFESIAREKGLDFRVGFDLAGPGGAVGDALRVKQIVSNLISNAVKFTADGEIAVQVSLKRTLGQHGLLRVVVADTGPGFGPEVKAKLFSRFEQGDSSVTRRFGGTGLGLAIAQHLATAVGGRITCDATPGEGARFAFEAPVALAEPPSRQAHERLELPAAAPARLAVLLAEDNEVNQKVVQAMLGEIADVVVAPDGQAALDALETRAFDIVLMDVHMPVMDGLTAIRRIRAEERRTGAARMPIVSLTADAMPEQVRTVLAAGADLHLAKPITAERLLGAIGRCLAAHQGEPDLQAG
jgi:signal transduction histidine kinase/CheY-like chemotaxis protein